MWRKRWQRQIVRQVVDVFGAVDSSVDSRSVIWRTFDVLDVRINKDKIEDGEAELLNFSINVQLRISCNSLLRAHGLDSKSVSDLPVPPNGCGSQSPCDEKAIGCRSAGSSI